MTTTPQAALLSDAAKLADEYRVTMPREVFAIWGAEAQAELRRLDALVAHLTADRDDTANELALRTKHNLALTNERDQLLAKLQATQEPVQVACEACGSHATHEVGPERTSFPGAYCDDCDPPTAQAEPVQAGELPDEREAFESWSQANVMRDYNHSDKHLMRWGWQARAALSARKPLMSLTNEQIWRANGIMSVNADLGWHMEDIVRLARATIEEFCRINGIGLEVKP